MKVKNVSKKNAKKPNKNGEQLGEWNHWVWGGICDFYFLFAV